MKIRRIKHINEDTPQQLPQQNNQQPAALNTQQPANNTAQPQLGQLQPANQQLNNQQLPLQNNGLQQQLIDYNACATNINKFIGNLYINIQKTIKDNLEKNCPELSAILKDNNSPMKDLAKTLNDAFANLNKLNIKPEDPKTSAPAIEEFANFITALTSFNSQLANVALQQQLNNQQLQQGSLPLQNQQLPLQNNGLQQPVLNNQLPLQNQQLLNASYDTNNFGQKLLEKLRLVQYRKNIIENY